MTDVRLRVGVASRGGHGKVEGSAEWRVGKTVVTALIKGPEITPPATMMPSSGSLGLDATVQVKAIVKPVVGQAGERESAIEDAVVKFVLGSLDLSFPPRTVLTIFIQVLSEDGSLEATVLNAVSAALMDAGMPLFGTALATCIAIDERGKQLVHPNGGEEKTCEICGTYGFLFCADESQASPHAERSGLIYVSSVGGCSIDRSVQMLDAAELTCKRLATEMKALLVDGGSE